MTHNNFTYKELLREAYELTKKHFLFLFGLLAINIIIGGLMSQIPLIGQLVSIVLSIATTCIVLLIAGGQTPVYKDMLRPFKTYLTTWHYFLATLVLFLLFAGAGAVLLGIGYGISRATDSLIALGIAGFIFLLLVIYYGTRLSFFRFFIVEDQHLGPIEALKKSMHMTDNRFWKIVGYVGLLFLINLAGLIAFVIGLVFTVPMTWIAITILYKRWTGSENHHERNHIAGA